MCKVQDSIFQPPGLRSIFAWLTKSRVDSGFALHSRLQERILLATGQCLAPGAAIVYTTGILCALIAEVVPVRLVAGHHLGRHVLFEHVAVSQGVRGL